MTKEQAIIVTGFTGITAVDFSLFHEDVEKRLKRPVFTHEFGSGGVWEEIKEAYKEDFLKLCYTEKENVPQKSSS